MINPHFRAYAALMVAGMIGSSAALAAPAAAPPAENCEVTNPPAVLPVHGKALPPDNGLPIPPIGNDCGFYNWAWHSFLFVTQKERGGVPAFLTFPTVEQAFPKVFHSAPPTSDSRKHPLLRVELAVRNIPPLLNAATRAARPQATLNDGITQAGQFGALGGILVDQNRNPIFYTINVNHRFASFINANGLDDFRRMLLDPAVPTNKDAVPADLEFPPGVLELKSSWMIVPGSRSDYDNYIVVDARVPYLKNVNDVTGKFASVAVDTSKPLRSVHVALLGLHVVRTIDGHPEFI